MTVVMPVTAPIMKVENCKRLGAKVVIYGANFGEAKKRALLIGQKKRLLYVNGSVYNIWAGYLSPGVGFEERALYWYSGSAFRTLHFSRSLSMGLIS